MSQPLCHSSNWKLFLYELVFIQIAWKKKHSRHSSGALNRAWKVYVQARIGPQFLSNLSRSSLMRNLLGALFQNLGLYNICVIYTWTKCQRSKEEAFEPSISFTLMNKLWACGHRFSLWPMRSPWTTPYTWLSNSLHWCIFKLEVLSEKKHVNKNKNHIYPNNNNWALSFTR